MFPAIRNGLSLILHLVSSYVSFKSYLQYPLLWKDIPDSTLLPRKFSWYFRYLSFEMDIFCQGLTTRDILFQSEVEKHVASLARGELKTQPCFSYRLPPIKGGTNLGTRRIFPVVLKPARVFSITASRAPSPLPAPSFPITPPSLRFSLWKSSSLHGSVTAPPPPNPVPRRKGLLWCTPSQFPACFSSKTDLNNSYNFISMVICVALHPLLLSADL